MFIIKSKKSETYLIGYVKNVGIEIVTDRAKAKKFYNIESAQRQINKCVGFWEIIPVS